MEGLSDNLWASFNFEMLGSLMKYIQPVHVTGDTDMSCSWVNESYDMEPMEDCDTGNGDLDSPHVDAL